MDKLEERVCYALGFSFILMLAYSVFSFFGWTL